LHKEVLVQINNELWLLGVGLSYIQIELTSSILKVVSLSETYSIRILAPEKLHGFRNSSWNS
jgi:hypothetical protein